jgi:hypothetical protein
MAQTRIRLAWLTAGAGLLVSLVASIVHRGTMVRRARGGERLLFAYNLLAYHENLTKPAGVLERLYVSLGHEAFVEAVSVCGSSACRHTCLPIHPPSELEPFLDGLAAGRPLPAERVTGFAVAPQPMDSPAFPAERTGSWCSKRASACLGRTMKEWKFRCFSLAPAGRQG